MANIPKYAEKWKYKIPLKYNDKVPIKDYKKKKRINYPLEYFLKHDGNWGFLNADFSGNILIIDYDCRPNKKTDAIEIIEKNNTYIVETPGGYHIYYKIKGNMPARHQNSNCGYKKTLKSFININKTRNYNIFKGIDILGFGGYTVGENSTIDNKKYKSYNKKPIKTITLQQYEKIEAGFLKKTGMRRGFVDIFKGKIDIHQLCGETGESEYLYWKFLFAEARYYGGIEPVNLYAGMGIYVRGFDINECMKQLQYDYHNIKPCKKEVYDRLFPNIKKSYKSKKTKKNPDEHDEIQVAKEIIKNDMIYTFRDSKEMVIYRNGKCITPEISESIIEENMSNIIEKNFSHRHFSATKNMVLNEIRVRSYIYPKEFDINPDIINCPNGYYNIRTDEFIKHNKDNPFKSFIQIPINYKPDAKCPIIDKFIKEVVGEEFIDIIYAFIGYCMLPTVKYQKAILLQGDGANGKSTLIDLVKYSVGLNNCESIPLQDLHRRFQIARLRGKLLNALGDISNQKIEITSYIKDVIAEKTLSSDIKQFGATTWINTTKHMFSCNDPPIPHDDTYAFWRRWFYIECNNKFRGKNKDPNMLDKLITPEELSGLLNKAIIGIKKLDEDGGFTDEYTDFVRKRWTRKLRPMDDFIDDHCFLGKKYWCDKQEFVKNFNKFWVKAGYNELTVTKITRLLKYYNVIVMRGSRRAESTQEYKGITLKDKIQMDKNNGKM